MTEKATSRDWHYLPKLPVALSTLFDWPPNPIVWLGWFADTWIKPSRLWMWMALALVTWFYFLPEKSMMQTWQWSWVAQIYLRNLFLIIMVAGGLHLYFYVVKRQGDNRRFDARPATRNQSKFTFKNQVYDNMFWTLGSGVFFWTAYECLYMWAWANDVVPSLTWSENPIWFCALFLLLPIWSSMHFYWVHRFLHWPPVYKVAHALHHRNVNIGPWTGISMHPLEHVIYFTNIALHFVVASHPIHVLYQMLLQGLSPAVSHSGYEGITVNDKIRFHTGDFFHQLHHRFFECNYGTYEMPWDRWFGTFHDGSEEGTIAAKHRVKLNYGER